MNFKYFIIVCATYTSLTLSMNNGELVNNYSNRNNKLEVQKGPDLLANYLFCAVKCQKQPGSMFRKCETPEQTKFCRFHIDGMEPIEDNANKTLFLKSWRNIKYFACLFASKIKNYYNNLKKI